MSEKSISKLFSSNKLNDIHQLVGGLTGSASTNNDTTSTTTYDQETTSASGGCDGTNTGFIGSTKGENDNPSSISTRTISYKML